MTPYSLEWWWSLYDLALYRIELDPICYRTLADWIQERINQSVGGRPMNYLIIGLITASFAWSMWLITTATASIHEKLNALKEKAKSAKTKEELKTVWEELIEVNKECWHKSFSSKVIEIKTIIETKVIRFSEEQTEVKCCTGGYVIEKDQFGATGKIFKCVKCNTLK